MSDIIKIAMGELNMAVENEVMKVVQKVGISVNKEELIKALELSNTLVRCKECKLHNTHLCFMAFELIATDDDDYCSRGRRATDE